MHETIEDDTDFLARLLKPIGNRMSPEFARELLQAHADPAVQARLDELAEKSNAGMLTEDERIEYETYVHAIDFIAILQTQARALLDTEPEPRGLA